MPPKLKPTLFHVALAFGVGAIVAAAWAAATKRKLEAEFGAGAEELRTELTRRGSAIRSEIRGMAREAAQESIRDELDSFGITPNLIGDLQVAIEASTVVTEAARRAGETVNDLIAEIRRRYLG